MAGSLLTDLLRRDRRPLLAICAFVLLLGVWNVHRYPSDIGFDATDHIAYADGLVPGGSFPQHHGEYYTPPGYYAVAGTADWVARKIEGGDPHWPGQAVNVLFLLGTVLLVAAIARSLWPGRRRIELGAAAFVALLPVVVETEAMFHPETMSMFLSTLALWLCVRTFADPRYAWALGATLGAAQLVRAWAVATVAAVAVALLLAGRRRELVVVILLAALIPSPWYIHQRIKYGGQPTFPQPVTSSKPLLERRPLSFYIDPAIPGIVTAPYRRHHIGLAIPTTYDGVWGDFFGTWAWHSGARIDGTVKVVTTPSASARHQLVLQSALGLLPTLLALGGVIALARASIRRKQGLAVALLPAFGVLLYCYFAVGYWTKDGDLLKATYLLATTAGWALGFGYALDRLKGNTWRATAVALTLIALAELPFLVY